MTYGQIRNPVMVSMMNIPEQTLTIPDIRQRILQKLQQKTDFLPKSDASVCTATIERSVCTATIEQTKMKTTAETAEMTTEMTAETTAETAEMKDATADLKRNEVEIDDDDIQPSTSTDSVMSTMKDTLDITSTFDKKLASTIDICIKNTVRERVGIG